MGILAHVDAGKTTLTERLLYAAGIIEEPGSVDAGTTITDSLPLERARGITIKAAAVSFELDGVVVNLVDTPGHPDFIAEVARTLQLLDAAVLVVSAVEGVQPQTRVLLRALQRFRLPAVIFVNKIDRRGASRDDLVPALTRRLIPALVALGTVRHAGEPDASFRPADFSEPSWRVRVAEALAEHDEDILRALVDGQGLPSPERLRAALVDQTRRGLAYPVLFGSAMTGAGIEELGHVLAEVLPTEEHCEDGPVAGRVFKVERGDGGEKIAYVQLRSGALRVRETIRRVGGRDELGRVSAIRVFEQGTTSPSDVLLAGGLAKVWGLRGARVGDAIGVDAASGDDYQFPPPRLEAGIVSRRQAERPALWDALGQLAEQDPLINLRLDQHRQQLFVSLYGEVQKEVLAQTLAADYGLEVVFEDTTTIYVERPIAGGDEVQEAGKLGNPFGATIGFRVEPAAMGQGILYRLEAPAGNLPPSFHKAIEDAVRETLSQGLYGWQVIACAVTLIEARYLTGSTPSEYRKLAPLVVMAALRRAGTAVYGPRSHFWLEGPTDVLGPVLAALARFEANTESPVYRGDSCVLEGSLPEQRGHELQRRIPELTRGEGVLELTFGGYQPLRGPAPRRPRTDWNPLNRQEYLLHLRRTLR